MTNLQIFSLIGLILYFVILIIVVLKEKKNTTTLDYFFAGRTLPFWALSITFIASWWGAGSAISTADLAFTDGLGAFWYYGVPVLISTFLLIIFAKKIRKVNYLTQGEMMKARYSKVVAKAISILVALFMTVTAASQMVGIGDFFGTYLGLQYTESVLIGTSIVVVYSFFGGFRGVVLTDIIQFVLLLISALVVLYYAFDISGGWENIAIKAESKGIKNYTSFFAGAEKYLSYVITFGCAWMIQANVWQRISATRNTKDAQKMAVMSFFAYIPLYLIVVFTGMAAIAIYDTIPEGGVVTAIVIDHLDPIVGALVFVGISAAIMSTMDSLINTGAMTLAIDISPIKGDDKKELRVGRISTFIVVAIALVIALEIRSILTISWIASDIITTGVFVPLVGGFIWRRATSQAALSSIIAGGVYSLYNLLIFLGVELPHFWELESTWQVLLGLAISSIIFVVVSLLTPAEYKKVDEFMKFKEKEE